MKNSRTVWLIPVLVVSTVKAASIGDFGTKSCPRSLACTSEVCNQASEQLLKNLDQRVDPCDNFYLFACGGYLRSKKIPNDQTQISTLTELNKVVINQLHSVIKQPVQDEEPHTFKLAKQLYNVCMNTSHIEDNGLKTAKRMLKELGGWPIIEGDSWQEHNFDWKEQMFRLRQYGFDVNKFLGITVGLNAKNSSQNIVIIDQAVLPINRINLLYGFNNSIVQSYYKYLVDLAVIFGADKNEALFQFKEAIEFMISIGKITLAPEERRNFTALTNIMTIAELNNKFPHMDWLNFINNIIGIPDIQLYENDTVDVGTLKFVDDLNVLLSNTPKRVQANYIIGVAVASIAYTLNEEVRNSEFKLLQELTGTEALLPRWNECLTFVMMRLKAAVGALYARSFFQENSKLTVETIVSNLHSKLIEILEKVDWMDEQTRKKALEKASAVKSLVGYPVELMDDGKLDEFYKKLRPSDDYLQFAINIQKFDSNRRLKTVREEVKKRYWVENSGANDVNAFYNLAENTILLPAGILQGMMYDLKRPNAMNYGAIGFIVGHELTHGFDDMGKQINKDGQLQNWWSYNTTVEYAKKAQCILNQYSNYKSDFLRIKLNGIITQGENIADNGGAKISYETYQSWLKHNGDDMCLPKLNYTQNQLFWIALGNAWCSSERISHFRTEMIASAHPPAYFRVIGIVSNSKHFAQDFQCPLGSPMNPINKCSFW